MKKRLIFQLLLMLSVLQTMAQNAVEDKAASAKMLVVNLNDGSHERFLLAERPCFVMDGANLNTSKDGTAIVYNRSDILDFTFEDVDPAAIEAMTTPGQLLVRQTADGHLLVSGLNGSDFVSVYSLSGKMLLRERFDNSGRADVLLPLAKGVNIVNIANKRTLKIQKK